MRNITRLGLAAITAIVWNCALAQVTFEGCADVNGIPVGSVASAAINDIAMATIAGGRPVIVYNPYVLATTPQKVRLFFYAHECGHHALGQVVGRRLGIYEEQAADCWGIRTLVRDGIFDDDDVTEVQRAIATFARGDWAHLPGPQRAINLRACLSEGGSRRSSRKTDDSSECMDARIESCVKDCTDNYGYPESQCRAQLCNPNVGPNRGWARRCAN